MPIIPPEHNRGGKTETATAKHSKKRLGSTARGYGYRWQKFRELWLGRHPLCVECLKKGLAVQATDVDHIVPHKGDMARFWDVSNVQSMCAPCHGRKTASEDGGFNNSNKGA